jgi:hypothetical protein
MHYGRRKHIRIRCHFVRECATEGMVKIKFVGTNDHLADILTKSLSCHRFLEVKEKTAWSRSSEEAAQDLGEECRGKLASNVR